jgi:hypothetical protein
MADKKKVKYEAETDEEGNKIKESYEAESGESEAEDERYSPSAGN